MTGSHVLKIAALAVAALAILPAAAPAQPAKKAPDKAQDQCFLSRDVNGFSAPNDHTVYVRVGVKDIYRLDLMTECANLTFRQSMGLESIMTGPWICNPLDATVVYRDTGIPERCPVSAIHKLTDEERAALPKKDRP
ncbi:MAG TPA: DUF6491 family protein [Caulobacteraceae bacterium]